MKNFKFYLLAILMLFAVPIFALSQEGGVDVTDPAALVVLLNPVIVFLATQAFKGLTSFAPKWILGMLIPALSAAGAFLIGKIGGDTSFLVSFFLGFGATFIHQVVKKLSSPPTA